MKGENYTVRLDQNGQLDELLCDGANIHLERMGDTSWWMGIALPNGRYISVNFGAVNKRAKFYLNIQEDGDDGAFYQGDSPDTGRAA